MRAAAARAGALRARVPRRVRRAADPRGVGAAERRRLHARGRGGPARGLRRVRRDHGGAAQGARAPALGAARDGQRRAAYQKGRQGRRGGGGRRRRVGGARRLLRRGGAAGGEAARGLVGDAGGGRVAGGVRQGHLARARPADRVRRRGEEGALGHRAGHRGRGVAARGGGRGALRREGLRVHMGPCAWGVCAVFPSLWRASSKRRRSARVRAVWNV
eukprot:scaffold49161_cov62-Phaeocystis_antarctica.AAC.4